MISLQKITRHDLLDCDQELDLRNIQIRRKTLNDKVAAFRRKKEENLG